MRVGGRLVTAALAIVVAGGNARAQLITNTQAIPRTGKPPAVFVNGYQNDCRGTTFRGTFGMADQVLQSDNRVSIFFDTCSVADHPPIEELGNKLRDLIQSLKYDNAESVPQVDVITHSMGGLVVRSYLSGKQVQEGVFTPPAETKIRKIVFLGTPHFGSPATSLLTGLGQSGDRQTDELQIGSAFLFDLATWNQGTDDLRGADAIAVLGNVSNGLLLMRSRFGDGVTTLTSGSIGFALVGRTRIVPYCHTDVARLLCANSSGNIADITSATHDSARIILSFLNDTPEWTTIGQPAAQNEFLSRQAGLYLRFRDANDQPQTPSSVQANGDALSIRSQIAYTDTVLTEQPVQLAITLPTGATNASVTLPPGATGAVTIKSGPSIAGVFPSFAAVYPRSVAPGSLISVYGAGLGTAGDPEVTVAGQRTPISFTGPTQINTLVPANATGLVKLHVRNLAGQHTVNLLVEPVVPAVFPVGVNAVTGALITPQAPIHPGEYLALYVTGLGATTAHDGLNWANVVPDVRVGGQPCVVTFAGRAPGYEGLDQINCQIAASLQANDNTPVAIRSGARTANAITLPVR